MPIEHVAIWTRDLERLKAFYEQFFAAVAGDRYVNAGKQFQSYFLTFATGARLELMATASLQDTALDAGNPAVGLAHLAFSVGSKEKVDELSAILHKAGYDIVDGPRYTGDGYYESKARDPDGNWIEITI